MFVSYQSEADLEDNLIKQLETLDYEYVNIKSDTELESNLKVQLEKLNNTTFSNREFNSILTHLDGGSIFDKAKKFRDRFELERDDNTTDYIIFLIIIGVKISFKLLIKLLLMEHTQIDMM